MRLNVFNANFCRNKREIVFICLFAFFFSFNTAFAQSKNFINNSKSPNDTVIFEDSYRLISQNDFAKYSIAMKNLEKMESKYKKSKDSTSLTVYYLNIATIFYLSSDPNNAFKYINDGFKYVDKNNNFIKGKLYELKAVAFASKEDLLNFEKYTYISKGYLEKVSFPSELADTYYNLITIASRKKDWDKLIALAKTNDSLFDKIRSIKIDLMLSEAYINKGRIDLAKSLIQKAKLSKEFKENNFKVKVLYHSKLAMMNFIEKDYKSAYENLNISHHYSDIILKEGLKISNNVKMYQSNLMLTKYELDKVKNENNLQNQIVKNQKLGLVFSLILILLLTVLFLLQYKSSKQKSNLNNELNLKNEELLKAIQIKNKLLDSISHELRTPLNAIKGIVYLFKENEKEKNQENIELLNNATNQLITLVSNVIDYNVIDNKIEINNEIVNLQELISQIVTHYNKIRQNENSVTIIIEPDVSNFISIDKARLEQILSCLIDNALKFTSKGLVKIQVSSKAKGHSKEVLNFKISDTGIGISKENLTHIFELFDQGSNEIYLKYGGSGLGLALVKKNIELFNGIVNITSEENVGSTAEFTIEVEIKNQDVFEEEISIVNTMNKCDVDKILIVEDNKINQLLIQKILTSKGYKTDLAENGQIAVDMVSKEDYCLILMDIMMPIMDGFEASKQIKKIKHNIPIIALTAISEELNKNQFVESEIEKILNKPIKVEQLDKVLNFYCHS